MVRQGPPRPCGVTSCHVRVAVFTSLQRAQTGGLTAAPGRCSWGRESRDAPGTAAVAVVLRARGVTHAASRSTGASAEVPPRSFCRAGRARTPFFSLFSRPRGRPCSRVRHGAARARRRKPRGPRGPSGRHVLGFGRFVCTPSRSPASRPSVHGVSAVSRSSSRYSVNNSRDGFLTKSTESELQTSPSPPTETAPRRARPRARHGRAASADSRRRRRVWRRGAGQQRNDLFLKFLHLKLFWGKNCEKQDVHI